MGVVREHGLHIGPSLTITRLLPPIASVNHEYDQLETRLLGLIQSAEPLSSTGFNATALALYDFQREHNPAYASYCQMMGAPSDLDDWRAIPAVPQSAFKHSALRAFPEALTSKTFRTSGTTGEGFGQHHFRSTRLYEAAILHGWDYAQLPKLRQVILTPSPAQAPYSSLSHMMGTLKASAPEGRQHFCIRDEGSLDLDQFKAAISGDEPLLLLGTALAFLHLFERGESFKLPAGSQAFETGGYKGEERVLTKAELYGLFQAHLGLGVESIINEYGMTELSSQFYTRGIGNPHFSPPWMKTVLINPETGAEVKKGETGMIRIFDLANLGSVQAIQTADLAIQRGEGFELLGRDPSALPRGCSRSADEMLSKG